MIEIRMRGEAYVNGYEGAFYRFTNEDGTMSTSGIWDIWYIDHGYDNNENMYECIFEVINPNVEPEDSCDWDNPNQVLNLETNLPVSDYELIY